MITTENVSSIVSQVDDICVPDASIEPRKGTSPIFLWLEITGQCQLSCDHCYANSGPLATKGTMTAEDWEKVIDRGAENNVRSVQFIGGEPTLNKDLSQLIKHATSKGLSVEVFSNLTHISEKLWRVFREENVSLATSYYSDEPTVHDSITHGNKSHAMTKNNIEEAVKRNVPIRVGIIVMKSEQDVGATVNDLIASGVSSDMIGVDYIRSVGRPSANTKLDPTQLCGHCGDGVAAILPDGNVSPCVFSREMVAGNVKKQELVDITDGLLPILVTELKERRITEIKDCGPVCSPICAPINCMPHCAPMVPPCIPQNCQPMYGYCSPTYPGPPR